MNLQEMNQKEELVNCTFVKTVLMLIVVLLNAHIKIKMNKLIGICQSFVEKLVVESP